MCHPGEHARTGAVHQRTSTLWSSQMQQGSARLIDLNRVPGDRRDSLFLLIRRRDRQILPGEEYPIEGLAEVGSGPERHVEEHACFSRTDAAADEDLFPETAIAKVRAGANELSNEGLARGFIRRVADRSKKVELLPVLARSRITCVQAEDLADDQPSVDAETFPRTDRF